MTETTALIVLGGGITRGRTLNEHSRKRYEKALEIHDTYDIIICSTDKSYRKLDEFRDTSEARVEKEFLVEHGVDESKIYLEEKSRDTFSNAYFCRKDIIDPLDVKRLTVITSRFHMEKTRTVFMLVFDTDRYDVTFLRSENGNVDAKQLESRKISERIVNEFYTTHLKKIYGIRTGDLDSIAIYMNEYNPSFSPIKDKYHKRLTEKIAQALQDKKDPLY
ncbi:MAG: YdcF family protein [Nanoarchaeota archaeon]